MKPPRSRWYWTPQEIDQEVERQRKSLYAFDLLYTKEDVERIARYIEMSGGVIVGGEAGKESLRSALNWAGLYWLKPKERLTRREIIRSGKSLRKAIENAQLLYGALGTKDAARHAAAVVSDLDGIGLCTFPDLEHWNRSIRQMLDLYIRLLCEEEKRIRARRPYTKTPASLASRGLVVKIREARFWKWITEMARIWELSGLPVDMGRAFQEFVKECRPNERRCEELSLKRPEPINERTVIDWVAKVRQPRERKL